MLVIINFGILTYLNNLILNFYSAARSLLCALYKDTNFQRVNEIHFRLGIIYKELNNFVLSLKHFKLALIDTSSSLSSVTKSASK